jgi:hypothetical protein
LLWLPYSVHENHIADVDLFETDSISQSEIGIFWADTFLEFGFGPHIGLDYQTSQVHWAIAIVYGDFESWLGIVSSNGKIWLLTIRAAIC